MSWTEAPTLVGRHLTLRPLQPGDRDDLLAALAPLQDLFVTIVPDRKTIDHWLEQTWAERDAGRAMPFAVIGPDEDVVGTTRYMRMAPTYRRLEIGATLYNPRVQRTGLNTEAKLMLLQHAFDVMACQCVQIRTDWLNHRSRTAIERLGAKLDGVIRGHRIMPDGRIRDMVVYSIIAGEWPGVQRNLQFLLARGDQA